MLRSDVATVFVLCFLLAVIVLWWRVEQLEASLGDLNEKFDDLRKGVLKTAQLVEMRQKDRE